MTKPRSDSELWQALDGLDDELFEPSLPETVVDAELAGGGIDPMGLAESAKRMADDAERLAWQRRAKERRAELEAMVPAARPATMTRDEVLARLDELRRGAPGTREAIRMAARKRKPEESSDDELRALLDEMEALRALERKEPG